MRLRDALSAGVRLVLRERVTVALVWLAWLLLTVPAALAVAVSIADSVGGSRVEQSLRDGFDMTWYDLYREDAQGLSATFSPTLTGGGAFLDNLEAWVSGTIFSRYPVTLAFGLTWALVWLLVLGGTIHRFVHADADRTLAAFLHAGGRYFFRFVRLVLLFGLAYLAVFMIHRALFARLEEWTRDTASEWPVFLLSLSVYGLTALQLVFVHVCAGYAKVAAVADDRRSMMLAAVRGLAFVLLHARRTLGLAAALAGGVAVVLLVYAWLAPGAEQSTPLGVAMAFLVGQGVLLVRLVARFAHVGGQVALYRHFSVPE